MLVALLLDACNQHPDLAIFANTAEGAQTNGGALVEEQLEEDIMFPYPKAGNGIPLPSERDCISLLLDDDTATFSHRWIGMEQGHGLIKATA